MCKRVIVIAVGLALLMAIFATCAVGTPSAEFFAVALRQHESRTLDLVYTTTVGKLTCKTRYVRTPEMLYREDTFYYPAGSMPAVTFSKHSYNRATEEFRTLSVVDNVKEGWITHGLQDPFWQQDMLDPVRFPLPPYAQGTSDGTLSSLLSFGNVSETREAVDGYLCWHVVLPTSQKEIVRYDVWLDENIGFCPRRIDFVWSSGSPTIYHFRDYTASDNGLWFPRELVVESPARDDVPANTVVCKVESMQVGRAIPKSELEVQFPSGTPVFIGEWRELVFVQP